MTPRETLDGTAEAGAVVATQDPSSSGFDSSTEGRSEGGTREGTPAPRQEAMEAEPAPTDPRSVVARLDDKTRVEVTVRPEGVEVLLDTVHAEIQQFDGLEDELRAALRQGDADLLHYEARDGSSERRGGDENPGRRRSARHEPTGPATTREGSPVKRGKLINVVA